MERLDHRRDCDRADGEPAAIREIVGIVLRVLRRIDARHRDAEHALGAEGIAGDRGDEGRVDSPGEPEHDAREPVLADVVAQTEDECGVDLLEIRHSGGDARALEHFYRCRSGSDVDCTGGRGGLRNLEIGNHERGLELRSPRDDLTARVDNDGIAVEHEFVLRADEVHVGERAARLLGPRPAQGQARVVLAAFIGRGIRDEEESGLYLACPLDRPARLPEILADGEGDRGLADAKEQWPGAAAEIPCFIEDAVIRQVVLDVGGDDRAAMDDGNCVDRGGIEVEVADDADDLAVAVGIDVAGELIDRGSRCPLE